MFVNGIIAIFQILLLPGLIFRALFKPRGGIFYQLCLVVAVSMLANTTIVYPLVLLHIYTKTSVLILMLVEVIALVWLYRGMFKNNLDSVGHAINTYAGTVWKALGNLFHCEYTSAAVRFLRNCLVALSGGLAVSLIFWFFRVLIDNFGNVFTNWDAIVSWNAWAQTWAQNQIPSVHLTYPQLLPLNLSLTYVLTGNYENSLFASAIMPIFSLLTVLMVFEMALEHKRYGYLIAVILIYFLYKKFLGDFITDGYADIPTAFMTLTALVPYLRNDDILGDQKEIILSILPAAAAALTKQVGLFILVLIPVMVFINSKTKTRSQIQKMLIWFGVGVLLVLPWYLPVGIDAIKDSAQLGFAKYINHSSEAQGSSSALIRLGEALLSLGKYLSVYVFLLPAFFLVKRNIRWLIPFFIIPFTILWGIIASYSPRNLSITFAIAAILCGLGIETLMEYGFKWLEKIKTGHIRAIILFIIVIASSISLLALKFDDDTLSQIWKDKQSKIFAPEINEQIFELDRSNPQCQKILTNYPVDYLPGLKGMQINFNFDDFAMYEIRIADPGVCWILVPTVINSDIKDQIEQNLSNGSYELLFTNKNWIPYRLIKIR